MQTFIAHARTFPHRVGPRRRRLARPAPGQRPRAITKGRTLPGVGHWLHHDVLAHRAGTTGFGPM